jgi:hypothetical protein
VAGGDQLRGRDRHPQPRRGAEAERGHVQLEVEVERAGVAQLIHPAPHARLRPAGEPGQIGVRGTAVDAKRLEQGHVEVAELGPAAADRDPQRLDASAGEHLHEAERVRAADVQVQQRVGGHLDDAGAAREPGEQRVAVVARVAAQRAQHLGVAGQQLDPCRVRAAGQRRRDLLAVPGNAAHPQEPAELADLVACFQPHHAQDSRRAQPAVPAGHRLVRDPEDVRDGGERGPAVHAKALGELPVELVDRVGIHRQHHSNCRDPANLPTAATSSRQASANVESTGGVD